MNQAAPELNPSPRILLGPGPSLTAPRVMRALASPTIGHLDPVMVRLMDDIREKLARTFGAADGSFAFAVSGTGTSGMETTVANLVKEGTRDRLAEMCERYGATVTRLDVEWGRAADPGRCAGSSKRPAPTSSPSCTRRRRPAC